MKNNRSDDFNAKKMSLKEYRKMKTKMLEKDFKITLTDEDIAYSETLTTDIKLDQWALGIINQRWW